MKLQMKVLLGVALVPIVALLFARSYFYSHTVVSPEEDFSDEDTSGTIQTSKEADAHRWFSLKENRGNWTATSKDGLKLSTIYLPAEMKSRKTALATHGYMGDAETMTNYVKVFHDMGYNVLIPDTRGHGESGGNYIGFGWPERKDYVQWINKVLEESRNPQEIILYDVSMGAATVMTTSGEKLPNNIKAIIEGYGYSSVHDEPAYQLDDIFSLPAFPLVQVTSLVTKVRAGYFFGEASTTDQLEKNQRPVLFMHGDADTFAPFEMLGKVYRATKGPKEKYVVKGVEHAEAYKTDPEEYQQVIQQFLSQYAH